MHSFWNFALSFFVKTEVKFRRLMWYVCVLQKLFDFRSYNSCFRLRFGICWFIVTFFPMRVTVGRRVQNLFERKNESLICLEKIRTLSPSSTHCILLTFLITIFEWIAKKSDLLSNFLISGLTPTRTLVSILMLIVLEMSLPRSCLSQEVNPTSSDLPPVTSSISPPVTSAASPAPAVQQSSEGFFFNGSSYAVISETLRLERGSHIGFSFRTCTSGKTCQS